ncbi:hypothetical protein M378DRAFT_16497 [Amanita muscaria Koide BX008]|uniref:Uncharacterized protein n=1 Tax=Amanita muscaria (strain Koide BX008) TaxID=946122 RepID=A0A0C2WK52_AMAMK|nr:hypothetical protein M378DRAFT_16497 [Amanita muscaria Koide BX008]
MSSPTIPSYVFPDTHSPSPTLLIPTPITLPVLAPLPVSTHYIPVNNKEIAYWSNEGVTTQFSTTEYYPPRPMSTSPGPPTSPHWIPVSPPPPPLQSHPHISSYLPYSYHPWSLLQSARNPALFDLLEMFQNITHMEFHTPGMQQIQDHLTVDLTLHMLKHGIETDNLTGF